MASISSNSNNLFVVRKYGGYSYSSSLLSNGLFLIFIGSLLYPAACTSHCHSNITETMCSYIAELQALCNTNKSTISTTPNSVEPTISPTINDVRLPTSLKPVHYDLRLRPELYNSEPNIFTFSGDVNITIKCLLQTSNITLHMAGLELTSSPKIPHHHGTGDSPVYKSHTRDGEREFLIVELTDVLAVEQTFVLQLQFKGCLSNDSKGFHKGFYNDGKEKVHLAFTFFEPTNARRAFPCFDEPAMKATFSITLEKKSDSDIVTLTNMPLLRSVQHIDGYTQDIFEKSIPISTYLVNFAFSNFAYTAKFSSKGTKVRVFSQAQHLKETDIILDLTAKLLDIYEEYFNIEFSLPKLDSIIAPRYLPTGMEQWGLITYRGSKVLFAKTMTTNQYDFMVNLVAHEVAHQWCGNLVSPSWWDDLWINEGFASFFAYYGIEKLYPNWEIENLFVVKAKQFVMEEDGFETTNPVHRNVSSPDEIWELFDYITYNKAAAVIRMMRFFLGEKTFQRGMEDLLESKQYGTVNHQELFMAFTKRAHRDGKMLDVESIMDTWIEQINYPVVHVTYNASNREITLSQNRFLFTCFKNQMKCEESSYMWDIPFSYTTSTQHDFNAKSDSVIWMTKTERRKTIPAQDLPATGWIIGNIQGHGYYRVMYSQDNWNALSKQLMENHTVFHVVNRAQLIDDAWALAKAGFLNSATPLNMMNYLPKETEYVPWRAMNDELKFIDALLEPTKSYGKFKVYMKNLVQDRFAAINVTHMKGNNLQERYLSGLIFNLACKYLNKDCVYQSVKLFNEWKNEGKQIPPDVKETVTCIAVQEGGETEWNHMYTVYKSSPSDSQFALQAMGCTRRHWLQRRYLEYSIMEDQIDPRDLKHVVKALARNPDAFHQAFDFILDHWKLIVTSHEPDSKALGKMIEDLTKRLFTRYDYQKVMFWRDEIHPGKAVNLKKAFDKALSRIQFNEELFNNHYHTIDNWLDSQG